METYRFEFDDERALSALARLEGRAGALRPLMQDLSELLVTSTKERFPRGVDPEGVPWAPNAPSTIARKGSARPLIGESRRLGNEIFGIVDDRSVSVGSALIYAAVMQDGARKGEFGRTRRKAPIPWADIPARQFVGLSADDQRNIGETVQEFLLSDFGS